MSINMLVHMFLLNGSWKEYLMQKIEPNNVIFAEHQILPLLNWLPKEPLPLSDIL